MDNPAEHMQKKREYRAKGKNTALEQNRETPLGWKPSYKQPLPPTRCSGIVKNGERKGERCARWVEPGALIGLGKCRVHGGQLPSVQKRYAMNVEEARKKLMGFTPDAVDIINDIMISGDNDAVRLKAAQDILDRTGILKGQEVTMDVRTEDTASKEIKERLEQMRKSLTEGNNVIEVEEVIEEPALDNDTEAVLEDQELDIEDED